MTPDELQATPALDRAPRPEVVLERMLWLRDLGERCLAESVIRRQMAQLRLLAPGSVRDRTLTPWPFS